MNKKYILPLLLLLICIRVHSQDIPTYNHYYIAPYFYNPAFMASKDHAELNFVYRQQWAGLEGAPVFSQMSFIYPISKKLAAGANIYNNKRGLLNTTSAMASLSYAIELGDESFLSFGMSGGVGRTSINLNDLPNINDPAISRVWDKSFFVEGQAGVNLQLKGLSLGISLPQLFTQQNLSSESFQKVSFDALNSTISSISYRFNLGHLISLQPLVLYRTEELKTAGKFEGYTTMYYKDVLWVGGIYRQDYGAAAYLGIRINKAFQLGYSYEFGTQNVQEITNNTHEFRLGIRLGKQRISRQRQTLVKSDEPENTEPIESVTPPVVTPVEKQPVIVETTPPTDKKEEVIVEKKVEEEKIEHHDDVEVLKVVENENPNELKKGIYVIVGVFGDSKNALNYSRQLSSAGYETNVGFNSTKNLHYVYPKKANNIDEARKLRDDLRKINKFQLRDTWILMVQ